MTFVEEFLGSTARFLDKFTYNREANFIGNLPEYRMKPKTKLPKGNDGYSAGDFELMLYKPLDDSIAIKGHDGYWTGKGLPFIPEMFRNDYRQEMLNEGIDNVILTPDPLDRYWVDGKERVVCGKRDKNRVFMWYPNIGDEILSSWLSHEVHEGRTYITKKPHDLVGKESADFLARIGDKEALAYTLDLNDKDLRYTRPAYETSFSRN